MVKLCSLLNHPSFFMKMCFCTKFLHDMIHDHKYTVATYIHIHLCTLYVINPLDSTKIGYWFYVYMF